MCPSLKFTVLSDIHHYSLKSGTCGKAYDSANSKSQKLLSESGIVLNQAFEQIADDNEEIVIISGDLTNNGELSAHSEVIEKLNYLKNKGKRVYVITATHDFRNSGTTEAYDGDNRVTTPTASRDMLWDMYRQFGPDEAISVHRESMSYIVQLCDGFRLFALNDDSNKNGKSGFSEECFAWISENAEKARNDNQIIIAMTHHPLIAPSPIYEIIGRGDMLGDYEKRLGQLADLGIQFIFTGHTHIHNISSYVSEKGNMLYDICCAAPIGYPGVYRKVNIEPEMQKADISTVFVGNPPEFEKAGKNISDVLEEQLIGVIRNMIKTAGEDIDKLAYLTMAISIKPKVIYKFGWIIKPLFRFLNSLKISTVAKWAKKESGLTYDEIKDFKDRKVVDLITELALNLYGGESKYPPETPTYKATIGFLKIIDSILRVLHIDIKKLLKAVPTVCDLVRPLLYNGKIDSYTASLDIISFAQEAGQNNIPAEKEFNDTVNESKKGLPVVCIFALILILFLPLWLITALSAYTVNLIRYGKKMK